MNVLLSSHVMRAMCKLACEFVPLENGGVLLGWRAGKDRVVIDLRSPARTPFTGDTVSCPITLGRSRRFGGLFRIPRVTLITSAIGTRIRWRRGNERSGLGYAAAHCSPREGAAHADRGRRRDQSRLVGALLERAH